MNYIDVHGHINFPEYDADREAVIDRAQKSGVGMVTVGTDLTSSKQAIELAHKNENMWAIIGVHPTETNIDFDYESFLELAKDPKVIAIGECGLDFLHNKPEEIDAQRELFKKHIELANTVNKPLMLHVRNAKKDSSAYSTFRSAYAEALDIIKNNARVKANFHFFAGDMQDLLAIKEAGFTVSFTGVLTFTHDYDEIVKTAPIEMIMSETDCPYVAPVPYRGKRCEPVYVIETVKAIAKIIGEDEEFVRTKLLENAKRIFGII